MANGSVCEPVPLQKMFFFIATVSFLVNKLKTIFDMCQDNDQREEEQNFDVRRGLRSD